MQFVVEVGVCPINFTVIFGEAYLACAHDLFAPVGLAPVLNALFVVVFEIEFKTLKHKLPGWLDCNGGDRIEKWLKHSWRRGGKALHVFALVG